MPRLDVKIGTLRMANPVMLASGMMGETCASLQVVAKAGAGAVVTKSIGLSPRPGYPNPTLVINEGSILNAMGLPNPGMEEFRAEMKDIAQIPCPVIGSIFAASPEDFASLATAMEHMGVAAVELNLSCPHAKGFGMEMGTDPEMVRSIVQATKEAVSIPVFAKLTPNTHRLVEVAKGAEAGGCDAIVAINTVKGMRISIEAKRPILHNKQGGLSGPAVLPVGIRCVYDLHAALDIPIIGVGGISTGRDAIEYIMAGASAVQVGSAIATRGLTVFNSLNQEIGHLMRELGYGDVAAMVGVAHETQ
jgi:dihydroorotate dehydrogenase (NAD+) catalytic subunit